MAIAVRGLKVKPSYEQLAGVASSYGLEQIEFPNRDAGFLRDGFILSQLDGEGMGQMQLQQEQASKQAFEEHLVKQIAINTGSDLSDLRNQSEADLRTERVNQALNPNAQFCNISRDHEMESMHSLPPRIETEIRDNMSTRTIPPSGATYLPSLNRSPAMSGVAPQGSAVAGLTHELERQIAIAEYEKRQKLRQTRQLETV